MRVTEVRLAQNIGAHFRALWLIKGKRRVSDTGAEAVLAAKGIPVVDPQEILSQACPKQEWVDLPPWLTPDSTPQWEKREVPCHVFGLKFSPIMGMSQVQLITNSIVQPSLPKAVLDEATDNTVEEDERVKEAILHAHLLDSCQDKLPRILDVINKPGWSDPLEYGIPLARKNKTLSYQLLLLLDQIVPEAAQRQLVEDTMAQITLKHSDRLMRMHHRAAFILSSSTPLPQLMDTAEIKSLEEAPMPDIYPLSPFINCRAWWNYSLDSDRYGVTSSGLHPHTIFIHHNQPRMPHTENNFYGISLLYAFSHAAAYAREILKVEEGDLEKPVVLQIVHNYRQHYHLGVFQLNTLNMTGSTKNVFWTQPWEVLFSKCGFQAARPVLEGYNPRVFSLLKGLHAQR